MSKVKVERQTVYAENCTGKKLINTRKYEVIRNSNKSEKFDKLVMLDDCVFTQCNDILISKGKRYPLKYRIIEYLDDNVIEYKVCTLCNIKKPLTEFSKKQYRYKGEYPDKYYRVSHCKACCSKQSLERYRNNKGTCRETHRSYYAKNRKNLLHRLSQWRQTPKGRYSNYKHGAKRRRIKFNLSFDEFMQFWQKPCFYCNDDIKTIGLDRLNNNKEIGYVINNIVPCCETCNDMKCELSADDFIAHGYKIVTNHMKNTFATPIVQKKEELENAEQNNNVQSNT